MKPLPNESYVNELKLRKEFPVILKLLSKFIEDKKLNYDLENMVRGECATLIRRHIPFLTKSSIGFNVKNIDKVYIDKDSNKVLHFKFIRHYGACNDDFIINKMNEIFHELYPFIGIYDLSRNLDNITENIRNFK